MKPYIEEVYKEGLRFGFERKATLFAQASEFQTVEIAESARHGRVLLNDGAFMLSERDERIYHEMMAHSALNVHPRAESVLIVGGGDGGTAREALRHPRVKAVTMVEIDAMVVEACRKFLPQTAACLEDPRLSLRIGDGVAFMRDSREVYDVILIDSTDPNGAAQPLFGEAFYDDLLKRLAPDGIVVAQGESPFYELEMQKTLMRIASPRFRYVSMLNFTNMTYPGGLWSFLWASPEYHPVKDLRPSMLDCFYYNAAVHKAAFQLPEFQRRALAEWTRI